MNVNRQKILILFVALFLIIGQVLPILESVVYAEGENATYGNFELTRDELSSLATALVVNLDNRIENLEDAGKDDMTIYSIINLEALDSLSPDLSFSAENGKLRVTRKSTNTVQDIQLTYEVDSYDINTNESGTVKFTLDKMEVKEGYITLYGTQTVTKGTRTRLDGVSGGEQPRIGVSILDENGTLSQPEIEVYNSPNGVKPRSVAEVKEDDDDEKAGLFERAGAYLIASTALRSFASAYLTMGEYPSIEKLIFNQFSNTRLSLFTDMGDENEYLTSGSVRGIINDFFSFFTKIAIIAYVVILVYMGIRILLGAGAGKKARYSELFMYWVQGILILFFFPYVIKYTILLNDAFVNFIYINKDNITNMGDSIKKQVGEPTLEGVEKPTSLGEVSSSSEKIGKSLQSGTDYMSLMFQYTWNKGWLVYALCWAMMIKQLLGLLIIYMKRLIIVIFLVTIFPLVTISYAIDKIGDGKSQAFNNWYKEFCLNVFIQSFHAIVYVLGMALIVSLGQIGGVTFVRNSWLLVMMVIAFISKGDDMLRNIFHMKGGGADTVKGVGKTILATKGAISLAKDAKSFVSKHVGSESHIGKIGTGIGNASNKAVDYLGARRNIQALEMERSMEDTPIPAPILGPQPEPENEPPQPLSEEEKKNLAQMALDQNVSQEDKNAALNQLYDELNGNLDDKELKKLTDGDEAKAAELKEMLTGVAAERAAAAYAGGITTPVELKEKIELILEQQRRGNISRERIQELTGKTPEELAAILAAVNRYAPKKTEKKKKTSKAANPNGSVRRNSGTTGNRTAGTSGGRYTGTFTNADVVRKMERARAEAAIPQTRFHRAKRRAADTIVSAKRIWHRSRFTKSGQELKAARKDLRRQERGAFKDARELSSLTKQLSRLKESGKLGSAEYVRVQNRITELQKSDGNIARLRRSRAQYAQRGILLRTKGRTQKYQDAKKYVDDKVKTYKVNRQANRSASEKVARARQLMGQANLSIAEQKELEQIRSFVEQREPTTKVLFGRPGGNNKVRQTSAQKKLDKLFSGKSIRLTKAEREAAKTANKDAMVHARTAINYRNRARLAMESNNVSEANRLNAEAKALEEIVANTKRVSRFGRLSTDHAKLSKAQKYLLKESSKSQLAAMKAARKGKSAAERTRIQDETIQSIEETRDILRKNGIVLKKGNQAVKYGMRSTMFRARVQNMKDLGYMAKTEAAMSAGLVLRRITGKDKKDYSQEREELKLRSARLRSQGVLIRPPKWGERLDDGFISRNEKRVAKSTYNTSINDLMTRHTDNHRAIQEAQKKLDEARDNLRNAKTDAELTNYKQAEERALSELKDAREKQIEILKETKKSRHEYKERGIVFTGFRNPAARKSETIINEIESDIQNSLEEAMHKSQKVEREAQKVRKRANDMEERVHIQNTAIELVSETSHDTPIRRLAKKKQQEREHPSSYTTSAVQDALNERKRVAEASEAVSASYVDEASALMKIARDAGVGHRAQSGGKSSAFEAFAEVPGRISEYMRGVGTEAASLGASVYSGVMNGMDEIPQAVSDTSRRAIDTLRNPTEAIRNLYEHTKEAVKDTASEAVSPILKLSEEVMELARKRESALEEERQTILGFIKPDDTSIYGPDDFVINEKTINVNGVMKKTSEIVHEQVEEAKATAGYSDDEIEPSFASELQTLAASVEALNEATAGEYYITTTRSFVNNIKRISAMAGADPKKLAAVQSIMDKLTTDLNTIDEGIKYHEMAQVAGGSNSGPSSTQSTFQSQLEKNRREKQIELAIKQNEKDMREAGKGIRKEAWNIAKNTAGAAADFFIAAPITVSSAFIAAGAGSGSKDGSPISLNPALSGMGGYNAANKVYESASGVVSDVVGYGEEKVENAAKAVKRNLDAKEKERKAFNKNKKP